MFRPLFQQPASALLPANEMPIDWKVYEPLVTLSFAKCQPSAHFLFLGTS